MASSQNTAGGCESSAPPNRHGAFPILTFGVFALALPFESDNFRHSSKSQKTMENKHIHRSSSEGCALSSVEEHFLHTEGEAGIILASVMLVHLVHGFNGSCKPLRYRDIRLN